MLTFHNRLSKHRIDRPHRGRKSKPPNHRPFLNYLHTILGWLMADTSRQCRQWLTRLPFFREEPVNCRVESIRTETWFLVYDLVNPGETRIPTQHVTQILSSVQGEGMRQPTMMAKTISKISYLPWPMCPADLCHITKTICHHLEIRWYFIRLTTIMLPSPRTPANYLSMSNLRNRIRITAMKETNEAEFVT